MIAIYSRLTLGRKTTGTLVNMDSRHAGFFIVKTKSSSGPFCWCFSWLKKLQLSTSQGVSLARTTSSLGRQATLRLPHRLEHLPAVGGQNGWAQRHLARSASLQTAHHLFWGRIRWRKNSKELQRFEKITSALTVVDAETWVWKIDQFWLYTVTGGFKQSLADQLFPFYLVFLHVFATTNEDDKLRGVKAGVACHGVPVT